MFSVYACNKSSTVPYTQDGNWVTRSSLNGPNRSEAVSFTIGNFAYLATGYNGGTLRYADLWQYDPSVDNWVQEASLPDSAARSSAVGFCAGTNGYLGTGYDGYNNLKDFWKYDPDANQWSRIADFAGGARTEAVAFGIQEFGYVGTGYDGNNALKDFWQYDPSTDTWTSKVTYGGEKRSSAVAFVYKNKGYIVTGINSGTYVNDFWQFDPSQPDASAWKQLNKISNVNTATFDDAYTNIVRSNASAMVIGDSAYISTGENGSLYTFTWGYDFATDLWKEKTPFEGAARTGAVGFSVQNRGYIGTGRSSTAQFDDIREFKPNDVYNEND